MREDTDDLLDPAARWRKEIGEIYDLVSPASRLVFQEGGFVPVESGMIKRLQLEAGLSVPGYIHIMDTDSIRHIIKSHGTQQEELRGQVALERNDFLLLPEIFGEPETIENGGKTKPGRETVRYSKTVQGFCYYYTEELRTKKNRLAAVTFYKRKV